MSSEKSAKKKFLEKLNTHIKNAEPIAGEAWDEFCDLLGNRKSHTKVERISWPSEEEIISQAKHEDSDGYFGFLSGCDWLKSKVKPFEIPEFTSDEVYGLRDDWIEYITKANDNIPSYGQRSCDMETGYVAGFNKCLELIKQKLGGYGED